jgi:hypothetical protein
MNGYRQVVAENFTGNCRKVIHGMEISTEFQENFN